MKLFNGRKLLGWVIVIFLIAYVVTQPDSAAHAARSGFHLIGQGFNALVTFFGQLGS